MARKKSVPDAEPEATPDRPDAPVPEAEAAAVEIPIPEPPPDPLAALAPREAVRLHSTDRVFRKVVPLRAHAQRHQILIGSAFYLHFGEDATGRWNYHEAS
jgi:hypothetical protein